MREAAPREDGAMHTLAMRRGRDAPGPEPACLKRDTAVDGVRPVLRAACPFNPLGGKSRKHETTKARKRNLGSGRTRTSSGPTVVGNQWLSRE